MGGMLLLAGLVLQVFASNCISDDSASLLSLRSSLSANASADCWQTEVFCIKGCLLPTLEAQKFALSEMLYANGGKMPLSPSDINSVEILPHSDTVMAVINWTSKAEASSLVHALNTQVGCSPAVEQLAKSSISTLDVSREHQLQASTSRRRPCGVVAALKSCSKKAPCPNCCPNCGNGSNSNISITISFRPRLPLLTS